MLSIMLGKEMTQEIESILSVFERERLVEDSKDPLMAIELAQFFKKLYVESYLVKTHGADRRVVVSHLRKSIHWLIKAIQFKNTEEALDRLIDLKQFFYLFDHISDEVFIADIPEETRKLLIDVIVQTPTIKVIYLVEGSCVGSSLVELMKKTKSITELQFAGAGDFHEVVHTKRLECIARAMEYNQSITTIRFNHFTIRDQGLLLLLSALVKNNKSKLSNLDLFYAAITDDGANALIDYMIKHPRLARINYDRCDSLLINDDANTISLSLRKRINSLMDRNKRLNTAYVQGAVVGFFAQLSVPADIGRISFEFYSLNDAINLTSVCKLIRTSAEHAEEVQNAILKGKPKP